MVKASCTWGDDPDVVVSLSGTKFILYEDPIDTDRWEHGLVEYGSFELTAEEARELANKLLIAAADAKFLQAEALNCSTTIIYKDRR